jgi:hypothetical protein
MIPLELGQFHDQSDTPSDKQEPRGVCWAEVEKTYFSTMTSNPLKKKRNIIE